MNVNGVTNIIGITHIGKYVYTDTREDISIKRPCPKCGKYPTEEGHDPCIVTLPNVIAACCGHGVEEPYIYTEDHQYIEGKEDVMRYIKRSKYV